MISLIKMRHHHMMQKQQEKMHKLILVLYNFENQLKSNK